MSNLVKRKYHKPELIVESIDNEISLVMMTYTDPDNPPNPPGMSSAAAAPNSFEQNPFGTEVE